MLGIEINHENNFDDDDDDFGLSVKPSQSQIDADEDEQRNNIAATTTTATSSQQTHSSQYTEPTGVVLQEEVASSNQSNEKTYINNVQTDHQEETNNIIRGREDDGADRDEVNQEYTYTYEEEEDQDGGGDELQLDLQPQIEPEIENFTAYEVSSSNSSTRINQREPTTKPDENVLIEATSGGDGSTKLEEAVVVLEKIKMTTSNETLIDATAIIPVSESKSSSQCESSQDEEGLKSRKEIDEEEDDEEEEKRNARVNHWSERESNRDGQTKALNANRGI